MTASAATSAAVVPVGVDGLLSVRLHCTFSLSAYASSSNVASELVNRSSGESGTVPAARAVDDDGAGGGQPVLPPRVLSSASFSSAVSLRTRGRASATSQRASSERRGGPCSRQKQRLSTGTPYCQIGTFPAT